MSDMEVIKDFVHQVVQGKFGSEQENEDPAQTLNELAVVLPREIDRVEEKQAALEAELKAMQSLLKIVGQDMVAGISDDGNQANMNSSDIKVWGMLIDFKQTVALEEQLIKRDIKGIETRISKLAESLSLLRNLKRKVEATKRMMKVVREDKEEKEA